MKETKTSAVEAVRDLLCNVPSVQVESVKYERKIGRDYDIDEPVAVVHVSGNHLLRIKVRSNSMPPLRPFRDISA